MEIIIILLLLGIFIGIIMLIAISIVIMDIYHDRKEKNFNKKHQGIWRKNEEEI